MIKRKNDLTKMSGVIANGRGDVDRELILEGAEMKDKLKVFSKITVPVGGLIGEHEHIYDFEVYYILSGKGKVLDGGAEVEVSEGDVVYADKTKHYIENIGDTELVFLAVVINL